MALISDRTVAVASYLAVKDALLRLKITSPLSDITTLDGRRQGTSSPPVAISYAVSGAATPASIVTTLRVRRTAMARPTSLRLRRARPCLLAATFLPLAGAETGLLMQGRETAIVMGGHCRQLGLTVATTTAVSRIAIRGRRGEATTKGPPVFSPSAWAEEVFGTQTNAVFKRYVPMMGGRVAGQDHGRQADVMRGLEKLVEVSRGRRVSKMAVIRNDGSLSPKVDNASSFPYADKTVFAPRDSPKQSLNSALRWRTLPLRVAATLTFEVKSRYYRNI